MRKPTTDGPAASMKSADSSEPPPISAGLLQARRFLRLAQDLRRGGGEYREVDQVRLLAGDARQQRMHVHIARRDRLLRQHLAAELFEVVGEHLLELLRVGAAVVDGDHGLYLGDVVQHRLASALPCSLSLNTVRANPSYSGLRVDAVSAGRRAGGADIDDALLPEDRRTRRRGRGAARGRARSPSADWRPAWLPRSGRPRRCSRRPRHSSFSGWPSSLAAEFLEGDFDAALFVEPERGVGA